MIDNASAESFDEARQRFSKFLGENHYPQAVRWVEQADVVWDGRQAWVRLGPEQATLERAREKYDAGMRSGFGVALLAFSDLAESAVATLILPKDADAAQRFLMARGGVKMSAALRRFPARAVESRLIWHFLSTRYRKFSRAFRSDFLGCP